MSTITQLVPSPAQERGQRLGAITHVALTVRDLAVSVPWYRAVTGAEPVLDEDTGPFRHVVFALGDTLLGLHARPNPSCPVGANIQAALEDAFVSAQAAFERSLAGQTVADVTAQVLRRAG